MKKILSDKTRRTNLLTYLLVIVPYAVMQARYSFGMLGSAVKGYLIPICA